MVRVMTTLSEYLVEQLRMRGWSARELSRQSGVSLTSVLRALGRDESNPPSWEILAKIARSLRVSPTNLFVLAGLLPREPRQTTEERALVTVYRQLPVEHQRTLAYFADYLFIHRTDLFPFEIGPSQRGRNRLEENGKPKRLPEPNQPNKHS